MSIFGGARGGRAQTATIGFILITALVIATASVVVVLGDQAIDDVSENSEVERAEVAMTQFDASAARVALGESPSQTVELPSARGGSVAIDDSAGEITVEIDCIGGGTSTILNEDLGAVVYEQGRTTIAYQGGGVWRVDGDGEARMVSPPEFHYRGSTLTLPVIKIGNTDAADGRVRVSPTNLGQAVWPEPSASTCGGATTESNPVASGKITVIVESEYARGWGEYFETRTDGTASYPAPDTVELELTSPVSRPPVGAAVAAGSGSSELVLRGTGSDASYTDEYNSDSAPYSTSKCGSPPGPYPSCDGDIIVRGNVDIGGDSEIRGDVISGGDIDFTGANSYIWGDAEYYNSISDASQVENSVTSISTRPAAVEELDPVVDSRVNTIQGDNDNGDDSQITSNTLASGSITIGDEGTGPHNYYLEEIDLDGETLTIDTSDGDVTLAVKNHVSLTNADIQVQGSNRVNVWVKGVSGVSFNVPSGPNYGDAEFTMEGSEVNVPGQEATRFFVYGKSGFDAGIIQGGGRSVYDGVIYAPIGTGGTGQVAIRASDIYGGIVTGGISIENKGVVHYDRALETVDTIPPAAGIIRVTYLHVTVNEVEIEGT